MKYHYNFCGILLINKVPGGGVEHILVKKFQNRIKISITNSQYLRALPKLKVAPNLIVLKNTKIFYSSVQKFNLLQILIRKYAKQNVDCNRTISCVFAFSDKSKRNVFRIQNTIVLRCERSPWTSKKWGEILYEVTQGSFIDIWS